MGQQSEASYYNETTLPEERRKYIEHKKQFDNVQRDVSKEVNEKLSKQNKAELQPTPSEDGEICEDGEVGTTDEELEPDKIEEDSFMSDGSETKDLADIMDFSKDDEIPMNHLGTDFGARDSNSDEFMEEVESKREIPVSSVLHSGDILLTKKGPLAIPEGQQIDFQKFDFDNSDFGFSFTDPKSYPKKFDGIFDSNDFSDSEFLTHKQIEKERKRKIHQKRRAEYHEQKSDKNRQKPIYNTYTSPDNNASSFAECPDILKKFNFKRNDVSTSKPMAEKPEKVANDTALDKDKPLPDGWSTM
jgi:hypothetical protein